MLVATASGIALGASWPNALPLLALAVLLLNELQIAVAPRMRSERALDLWLLAYGLLLLSWSAVVWYAISEPSWLGMVVFALVVAAHGMVLRGRMLLPFVAYGSLAFAVAARVLERSGLAADGPLAWSDGGLGHLTLLFALVVLPAVGAVAYAVGARIRLARGRANRAMRELGEAQQQLGESHEELRQWTGHLEEEVARKTQQLEERNRHLSIVNATSFALREAIEDAPALERALRLIARLLEAKAAQTLLCEEGQAIESLRLVATDTEALPPPALPEPVLSAVADSGEPVFSDDEGVDQSTAPRSRGGFAVVPLTAKGRSLGALAVVGRASAEWSESERRLLMLIGRDVSAALEHLLLYRAALDRAAEEALLNEVTRTLNGEGEAARAVASALALVAERIGTVTLSVVSRTEQSREQTVVAHVPTFNAESDGSGAGVALSRGRRAALLAAPGLVSDRARPLILGAGGEAPRSDGEPGTLVIAPLRAGPDGCGALVASAREDAAWGAREAELLSRIAEMIARRLQTAEFVRLQRRRIAELAGLAKVAQTVQSTVDLDRLFAGFAGAMQEMLPLRALHIARLDDEGVAVGTTTVRQRGKDVTHAPGDLLDPGHPWFALKGTAGWSRGRVAPAGFFADDEDHAVLAALRAKGRVLGVAALVLEAAPTPDQVQLVEQAVGQLSLALDNVSLYQQATQRAARIQVLGNLARIVASVVDLSEAFDAFAEEVRWLIPFDRALMLRVNRKVGTVQSSVTYPHSGEAADAQPLAGSVVERVLNAEGPLVLRRLDAALVELDWSVFGEDTAEVAAVPVHHGDGETAIFAVAHRRGDSYRDEEVALLEEVGRLLVVSIERVQLFEQAERSARHDLMTGLPNYRYLHERLAELQASIDDGTESALILIDMDGLKLFNDTLGHGAGDRSIEIVGREIRAASRLEDFVARVGGDEFVLVMEGSSLEQALGVADRVHEALRDAHTEIPGAPTAIRVSIGVAVAPSDARDVEELLQAADAAMYAAKNSGGGVTRAAADVTGRELALRRRTGARPNGVAEVMIRAVMAGASDEERASAALADRYAVAVSRAREMREATVPLLRMIVAVVASERVANPRSVPERETAIMLVEGLWQRWREHSADETELADQVAAGAVALAWIERPPQQPGQLDIEDALRLFHERTEELAADLRAELAELARAGAVELRSVAHAA